ncbi:hypothetical protein EVJ58_g10837 [Rhodofomes roseus]|uniref:Uncharacterized protein n=1 Tax=Rhodofomes roseus TaxID=34475 RepID=A0A4Y9XKX4_9APHY|nr:hypothetical protein EVJ58_g10837 [Rhodofomes roseus]
MNDIAHKALRMDDILHAIFKSDAWLQFKDEDDRRKNFARIARTCKAFSHYAVPAVWKNRTDQEWLESDHYESGDPPERNKGYSWIFDAPFAPGSVARFQEHAAFVHALNIHRRPRLDSSIFFALEYAGLYGPLLTALKILDCQTSPFMWEAIKWVAGPSLRSLSCNLRLRLETIDTPDDYLILAAAPGEAHRMERLLRDLKSSSPLLDTLCVSDDDLEWDLSQIVPAFTNLQNLDLSECRFGRITIETLLSLDALPHLHTLRLPKIPLIVGQRASVPSSVSRLENLHIAGSTLSIAQIMQTIHPSHLRLISISGFFDYSAIARDVLEPVCIRCAGTLKEVRLHCDGDYPNDHSLALMDVLQPFVPARSIHTFAMYIQGSRHSVPDADLRTLAQLWPALRVFELGSSNGPYMTEKPSLQAIVDLAHACPELEEISLPCAVWPTIDEKPEDEERYATHCRSNNVKLDRRTSVE